MKKNKLEIIELNSEYASILSKKLSGESTDYMQYFTPFADYSENYIRDILNKKIDDKYFGLFYNDDLAGFYMLRGFDEGYEIPSYGVWISSEYSNKGLTTLTLYHASSFCRINKIKTLMLKVHPENKIAKAIYEKFGFKEVGYDEKIKNLIYQKSLAD